MNTEEKHIKILACIESGGIKNQRGISEKTGLSLGTVNACLKEMIENKYIIHSREGYTIGDEGILKLEKNRKKSEKKIELKGTGNTIRQAVILAAGENNEFDIPEGLLTIGSERVVERIIKILRNQGITGIYMVVGADGDLYRSILGDKINYIENRKYPWTGTMYSLGLAAPFLKGDFLLIEGNQIFEESAVISLLQHEKDNGVVVTVPSGSMDEAYAELGEDGTVLRISKDIRQLNRIDGELVGISKITEKLFHRMLEYYKDNTNPMLNYEYVLESIGKIYGIQAVMINDLLWSVIENKEHYDYVNNRLYPRILERESLQKTREAQEILCRSLKIAEGEVDSITPAGGMTNTNFCVKVGDRRYILRIPGGGTQHMVDRRREEYNSKIGEALGLNPRVLYFDAETGIKITEYIPGALTLNGKTARMEHSIRYTTELMHRLHHSDYELQGEFSVVREYENYKRIMEQGNLQPYNRFQEMDDRFYTLYKRLLDLGLEKKPCHNDPVPENFIMSDRGRLYWIDWEYAGQNDPMWDVAAHLLECDFSPREAELFLRYYFDRDINEEQREKILIFQILQDILWSLWTLLKEGEGENFGTYGVDRLNRAGKLDEEYRKKYEGQ